jgi:IS30 family transposase
MAVKLKLSEQEIETAERLCTAGRTTAEIARVLSRPTSTVAEHLRRAGLRKQATKPAPPTKQYEVAFRVSPAIWRLMVDAAARRRITIPDVATRCCDYVFTKGNPAAALDVLVWGTTR